MEKKNRLAIMLVFILMFIIRLIGIENIPFNFLIGFFAICIILMFFFVYRFKGDKVEHKYLLSMTLLITLLAVILILAIYIQNSYPQISKQYKPIFIGIIVVLFFSVIVVAFANLIYKNKNSNKLKK